MDIETDDLENFDRQVEALNASLSGAGNMASAFDAELKKMQEGLTRTGSSVGSLSSSIGSGLRRAFDGLVFDGMKASDALKLVGQSIVNATYSAALKPITNQLGDMVGGGISNLLGFANGGSFAQGRIMPFAKGGVVTGPSLFPMRNGTGLMGEAGAEAIMPLTRGADGRLGVRSQGGGQQPVNVVFNVSTPDVAGFQRSRSQIAAQFGRALGRGQRNR
ncbi:phage tail tape measure protein [Tropicimonas sp. IMCC34043]|uniref:phage tail tape measure protein n=1 Tax=Tropicimonas sp. IMCC34043 TaxID=2248760 RepID=UPI000E27654D|nr:phage tail tape measure protein [Tropicimonas sp. IMCC34043]